MLFNSIAFMVFLPFVFAAFWLVSSKNRWIVLLIASYYFYMSWNIKYVLLIVFTTALSYVCGILTEKAATKKRKKMILAAALVLSLAVLFFFKYFNFFSATIAGLFRIAGFPLNRVTLRLLLPVGISFYTFQTLSYCIDVYKGDIRAEKHFGKYAVFVSFFPQLVAGPIERSKNLLPEIKKTHTFNYENAVRGMQLIAWGLFKKLVVADNAASCVNMVFNNAHNYSGLVLLFASALFAFQIYGDFSGYSDIARGTALLFDIRLMVNFNSPYFSASLREFWSRWHISLSTWFRDYVYIPLGGSRTTPVRSALNLLLAFLASGLWHGANGTFVLWGALHGSAQIVETSLTKHPHVRTKKQKSGLIRVLGVILTFLFVCFAWIFFRANTISDALYIVTRILSGIGDTSQFHTVFAAGPGAVVKRAIIGIVILLLFDFLSLRMDVWQAIKKRNVVIRYGLYFALITMVLFLRNAGSHEFVYFQF